MALTFNLKGNKRPLEDAYNEYGRIKNAICDQYGSVIANNDKLRGAKSDLRALSDAIHQHEGLAGSNVENLFRLINRLTETITSKLKQKKPSPPQVEPDWATGIPKTQS